MYKDSCQTQSFPTHEHTITVSLNIVTVLIISHKCKWYFICVVIGFDTRQRYNDFDSDEEWPSKYSLVLSSLNWQKRAIDVGYCVFNTYIIFIKFSISDIMLNRGSVRPPSRLVLFFLILVSFGIFYHCSCVLTPYKIIWLLRSFLLVSSTWYIV